MRRLQVWVTDLLIEFTERFLSGYARKSSLKFFVENKTGKTILLVWKVWTQESYQKVEFDRPGERSPE